jgi:hypothetical protein
MGYELQFRFDPSEPYDKHRLMSRLTAAGALLVEDSHYEDGVHVIYGGTGIHRLKGKNNLDRGVWLDCRALPSRPALISLLGFAERLGCTLHDPQLKIDVRLDNVDMVLTNLQRTFRMLAGLFGTAGNAESQDGDSKTS